VRRNDNQQKSRKCYIIITAYCGDKTPSH